MGNCLGSSEKLTAEIVPHGGATTYPALRLHGSPNSIVTAYIGFTHLSNTIPPNLASTTKPSPEPPSSTARVGRSQWNRPVTQHQVRSGAEWGSRDNALLHNTGPPPEPPGPSSSTARVGRSEWIRPVTQQVGSGIERGSRHALLQFIDARFPDLPSVSGGRGGSEEEKEGMSSSLVVRVTRLQHKSVTWQVERMVSWAEDLARRGGRKAVDVKVGSWKMEVRKFGKSYSQLLEVMMEHAQMEETVLFPILDAADRGVSKAAKEEHARDLPIMNGIKEIIKSVEVLDSASPNYIDVLYTLSTRLKSLQGQCKQHFMEEDLKLLPLMEAVDLSKEQDESALEQCFHVMQGTHSRLLKFLLEGLSHHDAMQYLDLIGKCRDKEKMESMLGMIVE